jgi:ferredoxin
MKVVVKRDQCTGHGRCVIYGEDVYTLDDLGYNAVDGVIEVRAGLEDQARAGALACPEQAIEVLED